MDTTTLKAILEKHAKWVRHESGGKRMNLPYANLYRADLSYANLYRANLSYANLSYANLSSADLSSADLSYANLYRADLSYANLYRANLSYANLSSADLSSADLSGADLSGADLSGADLSGANLSGVDLSGAGLSGACIPPFQVVPSEGSFVAWKRVYKSSSEKSSSENSKSRTIKILIPEDARRTSSLVGRKCRASHILVLEGSGVGIYDNGVLYVEGQVTRADSFDDDIRIECTHGIHFFMTKEEADNYA